MYEEIQCCWPEWKIVGKLGEGSFGEVYKIKKEDSGHVYYNALKIIHIPKRKRDETTISENDDIQDLDAYYHNQVEQVFHEIDTMYVLGSDTHIVGYRDHEKVKRKDGPGYDIFIRMELLTPLESYCASHTMSQKEILKLGIDICKALEKCAAKNILHRDIKPSNIFVSDTGDFKLGDFGIAHRLSSHDSETFGTIAGTFNYMAPEVFKCQIYDHRADIYSLGLVLYKLLDGELPFYPKEFSTYEDIEKARAKRMRGEPVPAMEGISEELNQIIRKACSYEPKSRYQSAEEFRKALQSNSDNGTYCHVVFQKENGELIAEQIIQRGSPVIAPTPDDPSFSGWKPKIPANIYVDQVFTALYHQRSKAYQAEGLVEKWVCSHCGASNFKENSVCQWCGTSRFQTKKIDKSVIAAIVVMVISMGMIGVFLLSQNIGMGEYYVTGCDAGLTVYKKSDTNSPVIDHLQNKEKVEVLSDTDPVYWKIKTEDGKTKGYVDHRYLTEDPDSVLASETIIVQSNKTILVFGSMEDLKNPIAFINTGDSVQIISYEESGYVYVYVEGQDVFGYVDQSDLNE